jgi:hypothetical protein
MSWECHKVVDYCKEKGDVNSLKHKCLVEWNDVNKTKSWVNYFALSQSNPKLIISFARNNNLLDKMPFCHLNQYCRSTTVVDIARILKVSTSPASIKYKFSIQVPKGIKNSIDLIIDKSLYGLKTSPARFHEHLSESLLRLGFKKTKHDPDL